MLLNERGRLLIQIIKKKPFQQLNIIKMILMQIMGDVQTDWW